MLSFGIMGVLSVIFFFTYIGNKFAVACGACKYLNYWFGKFSISNVYVEKEIYLFEIVRLILLPNTLIHILKYLR